MIAPRRQNFGTARSLRGQRGMTLIELMIACVVLAIGMGALAVMFATAMTSTGRNKVDSNSTLVAKMVLEQISAQDPNSTDSITITDCAGTSWTVATAGGPSPSGTGASLNTNSGSINYGGIDYTQAYSAITSGYAMKYKDCQTGGQSTTYDVRWNIITISSGTTRMITVSARQYGIGASNLGGARFAIPVTIRGIGGPSQ